MTDSPDAGSTGSARPGNEQGGYGQGPYGEPGYHQGPPFGQPKYGGQAPYGYGQPGGYGQPPYGGGPYGQWAPPTPTPKPGVIPLRPLSVGEILDGAFTAVRRNPKATLGLAAIVMSISGVVTAVIGLLSLPAIQSLHYPVAGQPDTGAQLRQFAGHLAWAYVPMFLGTIVVSFVLDTLLTGMLTAVIGHSVLGRQVTIGEAWRIALPRLLAVIGSVLLEGLILVGLFVAGVLPGLVLVLANRPALGGLLIVLGVLAAIAFFIIFSVRFALATPTVVLEGRGPWTSLARSWTLTKGSSWRVFGIVLLTLILVLVATGILQLPFDLISLAAGRGSSNGTHGLAFGLGSSTVIGTLITAVGAIVGGAVTRPVLAGTRVLLYTDLRMRTEGLDIALQTATSQQDRPGNGLAVFGGPPPPPDPPRW
jgi:hypothetical protein